MRYVVLFILLSVLSGCTISVSLAHTAGAASDVIDSYPQVTTEADAEVSIPASTILGV